MTEKDIYVTMKSEDGPPRPFYDRHFASLLTLIGVLVAGVLAISDNGLNLFINQPPGAKIKLTRTNAPINEKIIARAVVTDPDGSRKENMYKWEILETDTILREGVDDSLNKVSLPTDQEGIFTVVLTVIDEKGKGKETTADAQYEVFGKFPQKIAISGDQKNTTPNQTFIKTNVVSLSKDEIIDWEKRQAQRIVTNGHKLTINAKNIDKDIEVVSFLYPAKSGRNGKPGAPGANGGAQQAGSNGEQGYDGEDGNPGKDASPITVNVSGSLSAKLMVDNNGQNGGAGGDGGKGGPGGSGGRGEPSRQGILDCSSGPGHGAPGGNGGDGGVGGNGGAGGKAGAVSVTVANRDITGEVQIQTLGGTDGPAGQGGSGGIAGSGGPEGSTGGFCRPAGRQGPAGLAGKLGEMGNQGASGRDGSINLFISSKKFSGTGQLSIP